MLEILTPAMTGDLTTLDTAKRELGLPLGDAGRDLEVYQVIQEASARIARFCGRHTFGKETVRQTERIHPFIPRKAILLERDLNPVVLSVAEAGVASPPTDWELDGSILRPVPGNRRAWWGGDVVVTYTAGYTLLAELPADVERACLALCRAIWHGRGRDPAVRSEAAEGIGFASYFDPQPGAAGMPPGVAEALLPCRRVAGFW